MTPDHSSWNMRLARAIRLSGQPGFAQALEAALATLFPFQIFMAFGYEGGAHPVTLAHNMPAGLARTVIEDYAAGPWLLDPFYAEIQAGRAEAPYHLRSLAPDGFFRSEYYRHYRRTGITDELGFPAMQPGGGVAVVSLALTGGAGGFTRAHLREAARIAPVIAALMAGHWGMAARGTRGAQADAPQLDMVLARIAGDLLTMREIEVLAHILKGYSATAIGSRLAISEGTVKVHRKNAYRKLGISSQAELFSRFLAAL